jgi:hypothetical protein
MYHTKSPNFVWLHLSDAHLCSKRTGRDAGRILRSLAKDLRILETNFGLHPDFIFFTGDFVFGDVPEMPIREQFADARQLLETIRLSFTPAIRKSRVFLVPGNHDVNRNNIVGSDTKWLEQIWRSKSSTPVKEIDTAIERLTDRFVSMLRRLAEYKMFVQSSGYSHLLEQGQRLCYSAVRTVCGFNVGIAGLNSSWSSGSRKEKGKLWLGRWQLTSQYEGIRNSDIKILLTHHPFNWLTEYEDPSLQREAEQLFHFHLHGHEHQDWVMPIPAKGGKGNVRIAAGACYDSLFKENGYNIVRVFPTEDRCEIFLRRYDKDGDGWVPKIIYGKTDENGCWHVHPLGYLESGAPTAPRFRLISLRQAISKHLKNHEHVLAADALFQAAELVKPLVPSKTQEYESGMRCLRSEADSRLDNGQYAGWYFLNTVRTYYSVRSRKDAGTRLSRTENLFLLDMQFCFRTLDFMEANETSPLESIYNSVAIGRSPERVRIAQVLDRLSQSLRESQDGSLHDGCLICTATAAVEGVLSGRHDLAKGSQSWLKAHALKGWRDSQSRPIRIQYAAVALDALVIAGNLSLAESLISEVFQTREHWNKNCERPYLESLAQWLHSLARFLRHNRNESQLKNTFRREVAVFARESLKASDDDQVRSLRGFLVEDLLEDPALKATCNDMAGRLFVKLTTDPVWNKSTGAWGSDLVETMYRLYSRLCYWEHTLSDSNGAF